MKALCKRVIPLSIVTSKPASFGDPLARAEKHRQPSTPAWSLGNPLPLRPPLAIMPDSRAAVNLQPSLEITPPTLQVGPTEEVNHTSSWPRNQFNPTQARSVYASKQTRVKRPSVDLLIPEKALWAKANASPSPVHRISPPFPHGQSPM